MPIEQATTPSLPALKAYALGLEERRRGRELESVAFFNQAIELDKRFAAAYATLSTVYGSIGELRRSEEYARLAFELQNRVSERERLFISYQYHDRVTGNQDKAARRWSCGRRRIPASRVRSNALALIHNRMGRYDRAEEEAREALRRRPGIRSRSPTWRLPTGRWAAMRSAKKIGEEAVKLGVETTPTRRLLYQIGVMHRGRIGGGASRLGEGPPARVRPRIGAGAGRSRIEGRLGEASELYRRAAEMALARSLRGTASGYAAHLAWTEALYRSPADAAASVRRALALARYGFGRAGYDPAIPCRRRHWR